MSLDEQYKSGYQDGYRFGYDIGNERGIYAGLDAHIASLCAFLSVHRWLWREGDGYGGSVKHQLDTAFREWGLDHPEKAKSSRPKRKPLRNSEVIAAMSKSYGRCVACGTTDELQVDHIMPVSRGGTNDIDNLQMLCRSCNASKRDKTMEEWQGEAA